MIPAGRVLGNNLQVTARLEADLEASSARTAPRSASITVGTEIWLMAISGSFRPCPVSTHTTVAPGARSPGTPDFRIPATEAAEAGSQKTDSSLARNR